MHAKIITDYNPPPVPFRACDWTAFRLGSEPGTEGRGSNSQEAIQDLLDAEEEALSAEDEMLAADLAYDLEGGA